MFKALVLEESDGKVASSIQELGEDRLPEGDVTIAVEYSTLNYKDGMILNGLGRLVRNYPHVPGVDFAGKVIESSHPDWKPGDQAILTGWRVGEARWGGYAGKARVRGDWLVKLPKGLTTKQAMAIGTAGLTAMLCVMELERNGIGPVSGDVLVTGRRRRRRVGRDRDPRETRLQGRRLDRPRRERERVSEGARRRRDHCARYDRDAVGQAARFRALGGLRRCGRRFDAGDHIAADQISRLCRGLWPCRRHETRDHGDPVPAAWRAADRRRFRDVPDRDPARGLAAAGFRPAARKTRCDDRDGKTRRSGWPVEENSRRQGARPRRGRNPPITKTRAEAETDGRA
jgi:hypothetical protein